MRDDEKALARKAAAHDADAFAQLYDAYVAKIYKYIYYKVGTKPQAEDLTAQVFLKAWEAIGGYRSGEYPFSAWLFRIAHNLVIDYYRTHRQTASLDDQPIADERALNLEQFAEHHFTAETLRQAIANLTDDQQQVIILKFLEGYSTEEVANIIGKERGAVRALQHRALLALQLMLSEEQG